MLENTSQKTRSFYDDLWRQETVVFLEQIRSLSIFLRYIKQPLVVMESH